MDTLKSITPPRSDRLKEMYALLRAAPVKPVNQYEAYKLLVEVFEIVESKIQSKDRMSMSRQFSHWMKLDGYDIWSFEAMRHVVLISVRGDIEILRSGFIDIFPEYKTSFYKELSEKNNDEKEYSSLKDESIWEKNKEK